MRKSGLLVGMAVGGSLAYFFDPEAGERRRSRLRRRLDAAFGEGRVGGALHEMPIGHYGSRRGDLLGLEFATLEPRWGLTRDRGRALLGGVLTFYGIVRRGALGAAARTIGAGMLWNEVRGPKTPREHTGRERRRTVDIQKSFHIGAPVERVYEFWSAYENFPRFMSNVREVQDLGGGRSHWVVNGPKGVPIEWDAVLTQQVPGEVLAWRSDPGSLLENAGVVRFRPERDGTRVDLRLCYNPPAGSAGQAVAELLGADPRAKLNQDLGRLKSLLEGTKVE